MHRVLGGILIRLKLSLLSGYWVRVPYDSILIEHQDSQSDSFIWMFGPAYSKSTSDQSRTETIQTTNVTPPQPPKEPPPRKKIDTRQIQLPTILYHTVACYEHYCPIKININLRCLTTPYLIRGHYSNSVFTI